MQNATSIFINTAYLALGLWINPVQALDFHPIFPVIQSISDPSIEMKRHSQNHVQAPQAKKPDLTPLVPEPLALPSKINPIEPSSTTAWIEMGDKRFIYEHNQWYISDEKH